ncbi:MAG: UDP-3-O-[3-hydroxymyristoyl] N-acetylglucosamine deacetylase [Planctomycetaceae bacterium]|nr:UDP-3-O-[3-hydroxymyristoyl] N-acetylglucosamine deacetylase [Planctomycetaceae bacterium]
MGLSFQPRQEQTLARAVTVSGFGLFTGEDARLEFCPAPPGHGIVFERTAPGESVRIPALVDYVVPQPRCTVIARNKASVMVIEHVMAALAGLRVDNCLVRINAPEPPAGDGSAGHFVEALLAAGIISQDRQRDTVVVKTPLLHTESYHVGIAVQPSRLDEFQVGFILDYGPGPIGTQALNVPINPETFVREIARCRTFVLEREVQQLRSQGLGLRATTQNALVFSNQGLIDNALRFPDECVRHKILDCIGDFALLGCDVVGRFTAMRSGHRLNHEIVRVISEHHREQNAPLTSSFQPVRSAPTQPVAKAG